MMSADPLRKAAVVAVDGKAVAGIVWWLGFESLE